MLGILGVIFTCVGAAIVLVSILGIFEGQQLGPFDNLADPMAFLFGFFFLASGVGVFVMYRVATTRRFEIALTRNELIVERYGLLSRKTMAWPLANIERVDRVKSSTEINNVPLDELAIDVRDEAGMTFMTGRPRDEIEFVAAYINRELPPTNVS